MSSGVEERARSIYLDRMADAPASPLRWESIQHAGFVSELFLFERSHKEGL